MQLLFLKSEQCGNIVRSLGIPLNINRIGRIIIKYINDRRRIIHFIYHIAYKKTAQLCGYRGVKPGNDMPDSNYSCFLMMLILYFFIFLTRASLVIPNALAAARWL